MLYTYPQLDEAEARVLARIDTLQRDLRHFVVANPQRWTGVLARMTRAKALRASNSIEDINVSQEDAVAAVDGEDPMEADRQTWKAVVGYQEAMTYILQRCKDDNFSFSRDVILAIHFMISQSDLNANPGNLRRGWVGVRNTRTQEVVHEGVERELLEPLLDELVETLNSPANVHIVVKAALAHLNLTLLHPFSDGNGRTARCLQTAVLANVGVVAQEFSSIEEYIGHNQAEYYSVLAETGGRGFNPGRGAKQWIRFCLTGHYRQLQTLLRRNAELSRIYVDLEELVQERGLHHRTAVGMLEAAYGARLRNASYRVSTDVSNNLASRDLKQLVDAGLLIPQGETRGRHYIAGPEVLEIRARHRQPKIIDDPFAEPELPLNYPIEEAA
ncbi:MAG TPA: Fic family protein [Sphingomicrobium sp.]|nr:Fic family protein [Sphingomicrobium sp.]